MVYALEILEKLLALAGSVALALPFFRDQRLQWLVDAIKQAQPSDAGAAEALEEAGSFVDVHKSGFKPRDWRDASIGVACLVLSFAIGLVAVLAR
jgi:hypothetical protein